MAVLFRNFVFALSNILFFLFEFSFFFLVLSLSSSLLFRRGRLSTRRFQIFHTTSRPPKSLNSEDSLRKNVKRWFPDGWLLEIHEGLLSQWIEATVNSWFGAVMAECHSDGLWKGNQIDLVCMGSGAAVESPGALLCPGVASARMFVPFDSRRSCSVARRGGDKPGGTAWSNALSLFNEAERKGDKRM